MSLNKSIISPFSVAATYWAVAFGNLDLVAGKVRLGINGFADKAGHDAAAEPLMQKVYNVDIDPATPLPLPGASLLPNVLAFLEGLALVQDDFSGATRVD